MAKIPTATGGTGLTINELAPAGPQVGVCLKINDMMGVERPSFNNPNVKETRDVTRFVFGVRGPDGRTYLLQTFEFTISGAPGSNLMKFLRAWLGQVPPQGWDYCQMIGKGAMLNVEHTASKSKVGQYYANIASIGPVHPAMAAYVPQQQEFAAAIAKAEADSAAQQRQAGMPPQNPNAGRPPTPPQGQPGFQPPAPAAPQQPFPGFPPQPGMQPPPPAPAAPAFPHAGPPSPFPGYPPQAPAPAAPAMPDWPQPAAPGMPPAGPAGWAPAPAAPAPAVPPYPGAPGMPPAGPTPPAPAFGGMPGWPAPAAMPQPGAPTGDVPF